MPSRCSLAWLSKAPAVTACGTYSFAAALAATHSFRLDSFPTPVVALGELQPNGQRSQHATLPGGTMKILMYVGHEEVLRRAAADGSGA